MPVALISPTTNREFSCGRQYLPTFLIILAERYISNAELATGMMIICLPTLPGIFQGRHKRQPSRSILEGSGRSARYQNSYRISGMEGYSSQDNDGRLFRNEYVELSDIHHNFPAAGGKPGTVTNRIEGGYSPPERSSDEFPTPASGEILKTVTLEQRRRN